MTSHIAAIEGISPVTLKRDERQLVLEQARCVLERHYAHLPQKMKLYNVDPVAALRLLSQDVSQRNHAIDEVTFSRRLIDIFRSARDRHLDYKLSYAQPDCVAY